LSTIGRRAARAKAAARGEVCGRLLIWTPGPMRANMRPDTISRLPEDLLVKSLRIDCGATSVD
jgi:hypothetical protein